MMKTNLQYTKEKLKRIARFVFLALKEGNYFGFYLFLFLFGVLGIVTINLSVIPSELNKVSITNPSNLIILFLGNGIAVLLYLYISIVSAKKLKNKIKIRKH